ATSDASDPTMPPMPTTDAVAFFGKMSETVVNRLADQAWWPPAASAISATATHLLSVKVAKATGIIDNAQSNKVTLRARFTGQPRLIKNPESQPPMMLPKSAPT